MTDFEDPSVHLSLLRLTSTEVRLKGKRLRRQNPEDIVSLIEINLKRKKYIYG